MHIRRLKLKTAAQLTGGVFLFCVLALSLPGVASAQALFYKGKTITILNGNEPGGTGDMRTRAMVRSVGHTIYIAGRLFAYALGMKEPRFVTGYSGPEIDIALKRGEIDARAQIADTVLNRNPELLEKELAHFHAILEIPKGFSHPRFARLPEVGTFTNNERDRKLVELFRTF
ncbi:MAG: hypothetical protein ACREQK_17085, partial [Candidatus Binatia bacterium]